MRLSGTKTSSVNQYNGLGDQLYDLGGARPTLDLNFSSNESLVDSVTGKTLVDHTRASSATYVDGDGVIRTAVTNLLLRSEEFGDASWVNISAGDAIIQTNQEISPAGTLTADKFQDDTTNSSSSRAIYQQVVATQGTTYTHSVYAKAAGVNWVLIQFQSFGAFSSARTAYFNLSAGTIGTVTAGTTATITSVGDGWYRCAITATADATSSLRARIFLAEDDNDLTYSGTVGNGVYLWGAQLEESSTVGQYVKTTTAINSAPRFDHDPETGESLGLLVEESRTNLLLYSTNFDDNYWLQTNITTNSVTAPDGTLTAATYEGAGSGVNVYNVTNATVTASAEYTYSVYVKLGTMSAGDYKFAVYDTSNSSFVGVDLVPSVTPTASSWTRITYSFTTPSGCTAIRVYPFRNSSGITSSTVHFWGAQLEAGSFPTSYIPTEGSTVTRAADVASITGTNFSSWYNQNAVTAYVDCISNASGENSFRRALAISDGSATNRIMLYTNASTNDSRSLLATGGATQAAHSETGVFPESRMIMAADNSSSNSSFNGSTEATDTSVTMPSTIDRLYIGLAEQGATNNAAHTGTIRRITYWPTRLSNDTLQTITR